MSEIHLRVFLNKSEFHLGEEAPNIFYEGPTSKEALRRIKAIKDRLESGFLQDLIVSLTKKGAESIDNSKIAASTKKSLDRLVESVTSEVGRALVSLSVMQLCIKSIEPTQSIRLHKSSRGRGNFSWKEGVSMRVLDKNYITPVLREFKLVSLNADGFMMTRSLAENYPYSPLYKANLRGAREEWLALVQDLEADNTNPHESLKYFLLLLLNAANNLADLGKRAIATYESHQDSFQDEESAIKLVLKHFGVSERAARLFEIGMHSLMQAAVSSGALGMVELKPLSQMRSANKKHGNIGDIELLEGGEIVEAWDAKYGKSYLRDELEEVAEKLSGHEEAYLVGFVTSGEAERLDEMQKRIKEIQEQHCVEVKILSFDVWVSSIFKRCINSSLIDESKLSKAWGQAYIESLSQKRREAAPIDEPCEDWLQSYLGLFKQLK